MATQSNLVDELEAAFQNCLAVLNSQEHFNTSLPNDTKVGAEQSLQRFMEKSREMEAFFLQRRVLLSSVRPEQLAKEDIQELRAELGRKEALIQRYHDKLQQWPHILQIDMSPQLPAPHLGPLPPGHPQGPPMPQQPGVPQVMPMGMGDMMAQTMGQPVPVPYPHGKGPLSYLEQSMSSIGMPERR